MADNICSSEAEHLELQKTFGDRVEQRAVEPWM